MGRNNQQRRRVKSKQRKAARRAEAAAGAALGNADGFGAGWGYADPSVSGRSGAGAFTAASSTRAPSIEEQARSLITWALRHPTDEGHVLPQLVHFSREAESRATVQREAAALVRMALSRDWRHGWQPADVHRLALRRAPALTVDILRDAMAEDLSGYAVHTVDPRWHAQLGELEATVWWPADSTYLAARVTTTGAGWQEVLEAVLALARLLESLPALECLGPRPGEATAADQAAADRSGRADQRILSKVRALLAKAESTTFEAEAEAFTAGAQALMARHSIDAAMLEAAGPRQTGPRAIRIGVDRPYESPKVMLLNAVADANRCRTVWSQELGFATVVGFAADLRAVETLFTSLLVQATRSVSREGSRRTSRGQSRTRSFRQSFLTSFAARIGERLREVTAAEVDAAADVADATPHAQQLLPVLTARTQAVDQTVEALFPRLVHRPVARSYDAEGWSSGRAAADRASLDLHAPLAGGMA